MSATFQDPADANKTIGELTILAKYFKKADESLSDFSNQCKKLSPEDKTELAIGAAKEMGITQLT